MMLRKVLNCLFKQARPKPIGLDPNALYSGAQIDELLGQLMKAAGEE